MHRQGEFFFIPEPHFREPDGFIIKNEVLAQGGNPHRAQFLYRSGGTTVYVAPQHSTPLSEVEYRKYLRAHPNASSWGWTTRSINPGVYVKGKITHPEHATLDLPFWHKVLVNTEAKSKARMNVRFMD